MFKKNAYLIFTILACCCFSTANANIPISERNALIAIYNATGGDDWKNNNGWLGEVGTECNWYGVTCEFLGAGRPEEVDHVIHLRLSNNNLQGYLPVELNQLTKLNGIHSHGNQLEPTTPIKNAGIPISERNALIAFYKATGGDDWKNNEGWLGEIGTECEWRGVECESLGIGRPEEIDHVTHFGLIDNNLKGSLPVELLQLSKLKGIHLGRNQLKGDIPAEFGQFAELDHIHLERNQLSGTIPKELGQLKGLIRLELSDNQFSGSVPNEIVEIKTLDFLLIFNNCLSFPDGISQFDSILKLTVGDQEMCNNVSTRKHIPVASSRLYVPVGDIYIPRVDVNGKLYKVDLLRDFKWKPLDKKSLYWKLGDVSVVNEVANEQLINPPVTFNSETFEIIFNQIYVGRQTLSGTLYPYKNPDDPDGIYFQYKL